MTEQDRSAVIETITQLFWLADHHRWEELDALFGERVRLDYTSLQGGEPAELAPAEIVAGWQATLGPLDAHQHLLANYLIEVGEEQTSATASFQATHQFAGETWTLGGEYAFELLRAGSGWRIEAMTMTAVWQTGDGELIARAAEAAR